MAFRWSATLIRASCASCFPAALALAVLATACGAEPRTEPLDLAARPTPTPSAVNTPTPAPQPSPTPTPTPTPEPPAVPITDWDLDASSTGSDFEALLSEGERTCLQTALGDQHSTFQGSPLYQQWEAMGESGALDCLTPESNAGIAIWLFSETAGGLSAETRSCLADAFTDDPRGALALTAGAPSGDADGSVSFDVLSCLTPEEAARMTPDGEGPPPDTVGLRCLLEELEKLEGGEEVGRILGTGDPAGLTLEQSALLGQAVEACGIETDLTFPDPGSTG